MSCGAITLVIVASLASWLSETCANPASK